ncbi:protein-disulfide reductase DsbD [Colwellia sp. E2M01]|uniref:protein-disulfide reductase DsbD n=1 Tax=Colwellia sp. E2M01 TaxID=2841561 RepID=UPI001C0931E7|nr:protein-disulfide reductase DsbD [Colwellia sp. E2M01]MBU2870671.1 protein-disulfide reductase DsbD [Colwellia sp. E2M01]
MKNLFSLCLVICALFTIQPIIAQEKQSKFDIANTDLPSKNSASNDNEFLKVDQAFDFNFHQKDNQLVVSFNIAPGYYLYRHQFKFKGNEIHFLPVDLPQGVDHEDEFFGVQKIFTGTVSFPVKLEQVSSDGSIKIRYQGCAEKGLCYAPKSQIITLSEITTPSSTTTSTSSLTANNEKINDTRVAPVAKSQLTEQKSEQHQLSDMLKQDNLLLTLLAFFAGGLLLSFTPCVFPMYPILTGIIVGQGDKLTTKKAFVLSFSYVQGMAVTYTLLGVVVALAGAKFQAIFQDPIVLIALSFLFIFLALSMFGVFNLALPSSWQNKLNNISNQQKGGAITGVLIMGALSALVASPCTTAPLTGALLYISQTGDVLLGASALYALSLGMGLPLLVLGSSGGKLLPKAGAWMNIIKNIFGLLLLAVPIFLVERFIPVAASQALWALLILASATYFYVTNQNSAAKHQGNGFWYGFRSLIIFLMLFFGANLAYQTVFPNTNTLVENAHNSNFKQVVTLSELDSEIAVANQQGKTVMLDLYADWCIACKEFEKYTFVDPKVQASLSNTVWLQVDMTDFDSADNAELVKHFNVLGLPTILFFDLQGNELTDQRTTGFMKAPEFNAHIQSIF